MFTVLRNSGAPGRRSLTDKRANREVNVTPRRSVPDNMNPRRMTNTSQVRTKMKNVDVQFTTKERTAANSTSGGRLAVISIFYSRGSMWRNNSLAYMRKNE
jgi:hypothetical protein